MKEYVYFILLACLKCSNTYMELCPCKCTNDETEVVCNGRKGNTYQAIPKLPQNTTKFTFEHNYLPNLSQEVFANIRHNIITELHFNYCNITKIQDTAFVNMIYLKVLSLVGNTNISLATVSRSLYSLSRTTIKSLVIKHFNWTVLPDDMFQGLQYTNVTNLTLTYGHLKYLDSNVYQHLKTLKHLDLSWNGISKCSFHGFNHLESLRLYRNFVNYVPNFCNASLNKSLRFLDLQYTKIQSLKRTIVCLDNLEVLVLSGLSLRLLYDNTFSKLPSLKILLLEKLGDSLEAIRPHAFNNTSLKTLTFSTSNLFILKKSKNFFPSFVFRNCKNLLYLDISYNRIKLKSKDLIKMFIPLKKLKILKMKKMQLEIIPEYFFELFPKLVELYLDDNRISSWHKDIPFRNMSSLKLLSMTYNRIGVLNKTSFPDNFLNGSLRAMFLYGNPFSCTCELMWFRNWMRSTPILLIKANRFICSVSKQLVVNYNPTTETCSPKDIATIIISIFSSVLLVSVALAVLIYKCRWMIRYQLYKIRSRRDEERQSLLNKDRHVYDVYVIYSDRDYKWIRDNLVPNLEIRHGYQLCLRDRDFLPGNIFVDDMCTKMEESKTIMAILSNDFAKDPWCQFQLAIARDVAIEFNKMRIIPILLHEINFKFLNETVYNFISRVNYHSWNSSATAQALFWEEILGVIK